MKKPHKLSKKKNFFSNSDSEQSKFFEIYIKEKNDFDEIEKRLESLKKSHNLNDKSILMLIKEKEVFVPLSVFKNSLAPLEAVVLFLKEHLGYSLHKIALLLKRDDRTIWLTYRNAVKKNVEMNISSEFYLPISIFSDRRFSVLESLVSYLHEMNKLSFKQISELIAKNSKTIWTVYYRYIKKGGKNIFSDFDDEAKLFEVYLKEKEEIERLENIFERLKESYDLDDKDVLKLIKEKEVFVPLSVFKNSLAPLEAVVLFLKEHLDYSLHKIALLLKRDDRTIWLTHSNASKKNAKVNVVSEFYIPVSIFSDRKFSILESAVTYLKDTNGLSFKQISELMEKNQKTIWTVYQRFIKKKKSNG